MTRPPPLSLTRHAEDQATAMGISLHEARTVLYRSKVDVPSAQEADCRLAHDGRIKIVYNPTKGLIVTVLWVSHDRLPDRYLPPEQQMSGWINLDAKASEKLLQDWGFEIVESKANTNLWAHPDDPNTTLIPFSIPSRGSKANGKSSWRSAAHVVGVSVASFLKGRDEKALHDLRAKRQLSEIDAVAALHDTPDPLGVHTRLANQTVDKISRELVVTYPTPTAEEEPMPITYSPVDEKVLAALAEHHAPVTARALAESLGIHDVTARDSLRKLEVNGLAFRVGKAAATTGVAPATWWHEKKYTAPATAPKETPVPSALATASLVREAVASVALGRDQTHSVDGFGLTPPAPKLFTETGTPWPAGGILIQDEDGAYYVARKLVEEGR